MVYLFGVCLYINIFFYPFCHFSSFHLSIHVFPLLWFNKARNCCVLTVCAVTICLFYFYLFMLYFYFLFLLVLLNSHTIRRTQKWWNECTGLFHRLHRCHHFFLCLICSNGFLYLIWIVTKRRQRSKNRGWSTREETNRQILMCLSLGMRLSSGRTPEHVA